MTALGALAGLVLGALAVPAVRRLPAGIPERSAQPPWTRHAGRPLPLALAAAALGALVAAQAASPAAAAAGLVLVGVLVPAAAIDLAWRVVPDTLVVLGAGASAAVLAVGDRAALPGHLAAAAAAGAVAAALALASRGGFGLGDAKLIAMAGIALGPAVAVALAAAAMLAGAAALPVLALRGRGATLPLVPFLAVGILAVAVGADLPGFPQVTAIVTEP